MSRSPISRSQGSSVLRIALAAFVAGVVIANLISPAAAQAPKFTAKELLADSVAEVGPKHAAVDDGITRFTLNDFNGALQFFKNAKTAAKDLPPPELLMAKLCFMGVNPQVGRNAQLGRAWLERAAAAAPSDPETYLILGEVAIAEGRITDADLLYTEGLKLAETFAENPKRKQNLHRRALQGLAVVAQRREQWDRAKTMVDQWIKLDPESSAAHSAQGTVLFFLNKAADGYKSFQEADRLQKLTADRNNPPSPMAELNMAALYQRRDKDDKKTTDLINLAVKNHPKDFGVRLKAAQVAMTANLIDLAVIQAEEAVKLDDKDLNAKLIRGYVARLNNNFTAAEHFFELAHLQSPGNFDASNNLALLLAEQKDKAKQDRALEFAVMNIQRFPINGQTPQRFDAMSTFGWVQYHRGVMADAQQALQQVVNANVLTPDSKYYVAKVLLNDAKRTEDAARMLESAVESDQPFVNRKAATDELAKLKGTTGSGSPPK
jgi:tetratricopeptide (TPR) repeat protein